MASAPIYDYIKNTFASPEISGGANVPLLFSTPGHRLGKGLLRDFAENLAKFDITELPGADNLHFPQGIIKEAQELCAKAFRAKNAYFLVNGSTCGVMAAICCIAEDFGGVNILLAGRDSHASAFDALYICGADSTFAGVDVLEAFNIPLCVTADIVEENLRSRPEIKAVFLTSPNYYGICANSADIYETCGRYGVKLIMDGAHGAHLSFLRGMKDFCACKNADIRIASGHKTMPVLTMGSYLFAGDGVDNEKLKFYLRLFQTSSPSYIIMASLDLAREYMENRGREKLSEVSEICDRLRKAVNENTPFKALVEDDLPPGFKLDPLRVVINFESIGITGYAADAFLRERGIYCEMADISNAVFIFTATDEEANAERLFCALKNICERCFTPGKNKSPLFALLKQFAELTDNQAINVRKAVSIATKSEPAYKKLKESSGFTAAAAVTVYPPGIPVLLPGEHISPEIIEFLSEILKYGGAVSGIKDGAIQIL